jgi:imidazolonepropionase-like amidohydrolase
LVFQDVRVFDGSDVIPRTTVVVEEGRIVAMGVDAEIPVGAEVIDGRGHTLLPGLIDSHVHIRRLRALELHLIFGVTTVLDMGWHPRAVALAKELQRLGRNLNMADLRSAGQMATSPGGHGSEQGGVPTISRPEEAQDFVDARIAEGSDYIKIIYEAHKDWGTARPSISREVLAALVAAAHERGKLAVVHNGSLGDTVDALEVGADGLAHTVLDTSLEMEIGDLIARHGAFVISTCNIWEPPEGEPVDTDQRLEPYITPFDRFAGWPLTEDMRPVFQVGLEAIRQIAASGAPVLAGTDAGAGAAGHGASMHRELELLVMAGLTPVEALAAATSVPAKHFGLADRGRIAPDLRADLLLVRGDPTTDILATRDIAGVWKLGVPLDREGYSKVTTGLRALDEKLRSAPEPPVAAPARLGSGVVSYFDSGDLGSEFGAGWGEFTDEVFGGVSSVELALVPGGAEGSPGSLSIKGRTVRNFDPLPVMSGAIFYAGVESWTPANISSKERISFWARGDGQSFVILLLTKSGGLRATPRHYFTAGPEWRQLSLNIRELRGGRTDGGDLIGVFVGVYWDQTGPFSLQIDQVRFE